MTDHPPARPLPDDRLLWADLLLFVRRRFAWMLGPAVVCAVAAAAWLFFQPPVYEAAALLTLGSDRPAGEITPPVLSADGYLRLLRSRAVLMEAKRRLAAAGVIADAEAAELQLSPRILASRRGDLSNTSLLELAAQAGSASAASAVANAAAQAFLAAELRQVQLSALQVGYHEILAQQVKVEERYELSRNRLAGLSQRLAATPQTLAVRSRMADEQLLAGSGAGSPVILTQQPNPVYGDLASVVATTEAEVAALGIQLTELAASRDKLKMQLDALRPAAGGESLAPLAFDPVAGVMLPAYGSAQLLSAAVAPVSPLPKAIPAKALLAAVGGAILGFLAAAAREALAQRRTQSDPDT